jgi:FdhD protein
MSDGTVSFEFHQYDGEWHALEAEVIGEGFVTIFVNGRELATLMCTPRDPLQLALGFLANEGFIDTYAEVEIAHVCGTGGCVDIWLSHLLPDRPLRKTITSGCGGGLTFADLATGQDPVASDLTISPGQLASLIAKIQDVDSLYARARGVHTSALSDGKRLLVVAEDIGRHNTLDRLRGECLRSGLDPHGLVLLATGRISSEMIQKAVRMGCPVVASRTSPTSLSVGLARQWNITLCGYVRRNHMNVYAHPERLVSMASGPESVHFSLSIVQEAPYQGS